MILGDFYGRIIFAEKFFGATASAVGGAAAARVAHGENRVKPPSCELIQVGAIGVGAASGSHLNFHIWAPMINPTEPQFWPVGRTTRMKITHCWDRDPE